MDGKLLLDTNAVVALFGGDTKIQELVASAAVSVPVVVMGELFYGAEHSARPKENRDVVSQFAASCSVILYDLITAEHTAGPSKNCVKRGGPFQRMIFGLRRLPCSMG